MPKPSIQRKTVSIDATGKVVGRLATEIVRLLMGKHRATYTPNIDSGDFVHVKNAEKAVLTGAKASVKRYFRYSGYPGGMRARDSFELKAVHPGRVLRAAVDRMLPKNTLRARRIKRLVFVK